MARALSQVYTIIRGSVGGLTYLANQFHQIVVRARTAPAQPGTVPQTMMKSAFTEAEALWRTASTALRNAWKLHANTVTYSGPLGPYTISGRLRFLGVFSLAAYLNSRFTAGITMTPSAPVLPGWLLLSKLKLTPRTTVGTGFTIEVTNPDLEGIIVLVNVSQVLPTTRNFWKGPWNDADTTTFEVAHSSSDTLEIGELEEGMRYFVQLRAIGDGVSHRISQAFILHTEANTVVV